MKNLCVVALLWLSASGFSYGEKMTNEDEVMTAKGTFEVKLTPQADTDFPAGRMTIDKTFQGDLVGTGVGQMISKRTEGGPAVYHAIEEVSGTLDGKTGSFTLVHSGHMTKESQSLEIVILEGSGSGELEGVSGSMTITQEENGHSYELRYEL